MTCHIFCFHSITHDYCNYFLSGCPRSLIVRLQNVQNNAARLFLGISKHEHIPIHLHWLPIDSCMSLSNLHVFPTTVCLLIPRPTSLIVILFTQLPARFAHLLTAVSCVIGLFLQYPMATYFAYSTPFYWELYFSTCTLF